MMDDAARGLGDVRRHRSAIRTPREPLPGALWWAVAHRDEMTCQWCNRRSSDPSLFQVDHVIPYSAGGLDHTPNLRLLCVYDNERRSNFATWEWSRPRPIVPTCQGSVSEAAARRTTVYCLAHRRLESLPDYLAQLSELARILGRAVPRRPADPIALPSATLPVTLPEMP